jgi:hypothetical protein
MSSQCAIGADGGDDAVRSAVIAEREACAKLLELSGSEIRLAAGEVTPDEMRVIQAILSWRARAIRAREV